jgi:putative membrane protein
LTTSGTQTATSQALARLRDDLGNWRLLFVKFVSAALSVVVTVLVLPGLSFQGWQWGQLTLIGVVFGVLNAVLKPVLQFFTLRYLVASYGFVIIAINAVLLLVLSWVFGDRLEVARVTSLLAGGALVGLIGMFLDTLLGTNRPVIDRRDGFGRAGAAPPPAPAAADPEVTR